VPLACYRSRDREVIPLNNTPISSAGLDRALVLHGGGSAGNAWEIGIIAGLLGGGVDATTADLIVGTSAGATAAAQITATDPRDLLAAILDAAALPQGRHPAGPMIDHLARTDEIIAAAADADDLHRRLGASALELDVDESWTERWRATTVARLGEREWPSQDILITALDARTGEGVALSRDSGVDLVDAVAASTSSGAPYRIGDARYIDGGYRRNENADLAAGYARVLVLSPFGARTRHPLEWGMQLSAQVEELRTNGSRVETIFPDAASLDAFGDSMTDLSRRPLAARAGYEQGTALAGQLIEFWS
jgi:NTE family protein